MGIPIISDILQVITGPLEKLIPDKTKRDEYKHELTVAVLNSGLAQMEVNKVEAAHKTIFVAGWRPFIGWISGFSLAWHFFLYDLVTWLMQIWVPDAPPPPQLGTTDILFEIVLTMLGTAGLRTFEKLKGVAREK